MRGKFSLSIGYSLALVGVFVVSFLAGMIRVQDLEAESMHSVKLDTSDSRLVKRSIPNFLGEGGDPFEVKGFFSKSEKIRYELIDLMDLDDFRIEAGGNWEKLWSLLEIDPAGTLSALGRFRLAEHPAGGEIPLAVASFFADKPMHEALLTLMPLELDVRTHRTTVEELVVLWDDQKIRENELFTLLKETHESLATAAAAKMVGLRMVNAENYQEMMKFAEALPQGSTRSKLVMGAVENLCSDHFDAATEIVEQLDNHQGYYDEAIAFYSGALSHRDPRLSLKLSEDIKDPWEKTNAMTYLATTWLEKYPDDFEHWFSEAKISMAVDQRQAFDTARKAVAEAAVLNQ